VAPALTGEFAWVIAAAFRDIAGGGHGRRNRRLTAAATIQPARSGYPTTPSLALIRSSTSSSKHALDTNTTVAVGGTNLLDQNYERQTAFQRQAALFFANIRSKF